MTQTIVRDRASADARLAARNLAAEVRGAEEGHNCRYDRDRGLFLVASEGGTRTYELTAQGRDGLASFSCTCPAGIHRSVPAGSAGCKHATRVARRLERLGLVRFEGGRWVVTPKAERLAG